MDTKKCTDGKDHNFEYSKTVVAHNWLGMAMDYNPKEAHIATCTKCGEVRVS